MRCTRVFETCPYNSVTEVGEITQEKRSVHVQHGRHCLLVSPDVEGVTLLLPGPDVVVGLCPGVMALQHSADCDVVTGSEQQAAAHNNHCDHIIYSRIDHKQSTTSNSD